MSLFETATYTVLQKLKKNIEVREYPTFYLANTISSKDKRLSNGFNNVFDYISGANESKTKISMTTPVVSTTYENTLSTGFVIPSKFKSDAPKPSNSNVTIETIDYGQFIVIKFKGSWTEEHFNEVDQQLLDFVKESKYEIISQRYILRYQPPFIPSVFRRNEIMYRIKVI